MFHSKVTDDTEHCIICGSPNVVKHHLLFGTASRKLAEEDELTVPLCPRCHNMDRKESVHLNPAVAKWSRIVGQLSYELDQVAEGSTKEEARESFRKRYKKSYL